MGTLWLSFDKGCRRHLRSRERSSENTISHVTVCGYTIQKPLRQFNRCEWQLQETVEGKWEKREKGDDRK